MAENQPKALPLVERLLSVPKSARLQIDTPNALGCMDTQNIPVGPLCHQAAAALTAQAAGGTNEQLASELAAYFRMFTKSSHLWRDGRPLHVVTAELLEAVASASPPPQAAASVVGGWIPVSERLPEDGLPVMVFTPANGDEEDRIDFEFRDEGCWYHHNDCYDHFMAVGGTNAVPGEVCTGPGPEAPYTHWQPLPPPPLAQQEKT